MYHLQVMKRLKVLLPDSARTVLRALGFNALISALGFLTYHIIGEGKDECTKIVIRRNRRTALLRTLIHFIPVSVALWEIILNLRNYFIGDRVYNQAYYQIAAKIHEIAIQASLSAVTWSYIRYELLFGDGVPFGALFSGLQTAQPSFLWSMEFWGTVSSWNIALKKKLYLIVVITVTIFLAAVAGPSSAVLLLPRLDYWPAGSTNIWINVTSDSIWPSRTNASEVPEQCSTANRSNVYTFACPSHGWESIQEYVYGTLHTLDPYYVSITHDLSTPNWVPVTGHGSQRRLTISTTPGIHQQDEVDDQPIAATTQQSVISDALVEAGELWTLVTYNSSRPGYGNVQEQQDAISSINHNYYQPYTDAACAEDIIHGAHDETPLAFPILSDVQADSMLNQAEYNDSILGIHGSGIHGFVYSGVTRDQLLETAGPSEETRLKWIELPQNPFNGSAIGAIFLLPRSAENMTQELLVCNIGAGWGSSIINTSSYAGTTTFTTSLAATSPISLRSRADRDALVDVVQFRLPTFPEKPILVTEAWANLLNPFVPGLNTTVINAIMSIVDPFKGIPAFSTFRAAAAKTALTGLLTNGLASIGATGRLQGELMTRAGDLAPERRYSGNKNIFFAGSKDMFNVNAEESKNWLKLQVNFTLKGYAYNVHGLPPKVAIILMLLYCMIAVSHILYAAISGISSTSWDSVGEITALAMNSTPTVMLKNTCAGIMELYIFRLPVRILPVRDSDGEGEHLELVFGKEDERDVKGTPFEPNRHYGTLPRMVKAEKLL